MTQGGALYSSELLSFPNGYSGLLVLFVLNLRPFLFFTAL